MNTCLKNRVFFTLHKFGYFKVCYALGVYMMSIKLIKPKVVSNVNTLWTIWSFSKIPLIRFTKKKI